MTEPIIYLVTYSAETAKTIGFVFDAQSISYEEFQTSGFLNTLQEQTEVSVVVTDAQKLPNQIQAARPKTPVIVLGRPEANFEADEAELQLVRHVETPVNYPRLVDLVQYCQDKARRMSA